MKAIDLRKKTKDELNTLLIELSKERFNLKMQKGTGKKS
jgi:large subunit ribosomal protein L29